MSFSLFSPKANSKSGRSLEGQKRASMKEIHVRFVCDTAQMEAAWRDGLHITRGAG